MDLQYNARVMWFPVSVQGNWLVTGAGGDYSDLLGNGRMTADYELIFDDKGNIVDDKWTIYFSGGLHNERIK